MQPLHAGPASACMHRHQAHAQARKKPLRGLSRSTCARVQSDLVNACLVATGRSHHQRAPSLGPTNESPIKTGCSLEELDELRGVTTPKSHHAAFLVLRNSFTSHRTNPPKRPECFPLTAFQPISSTLILPPPITRIHAHGSLFSVSPGGFSHPITRHSNNSEGF